MTPREEFDIMYLEEDLMADYLNDHNLMKDFEQFKEETFQQWLETNNVN